MYDKIILQKILLDCDYRTLDDYGKPLPPSSPVYRLIEEKMAELNSAITAKHVYVIVKDNRNGYTNQIRKALNIQVNRNLSIPDSSLESKDLSMNTSGSPSVSANTHTKNLKIILSSEKWSLIKPVKKVYNGRIRYVLQPGWTDILAEKLWEQTKLHCVISFKKHDVNRSACAQHFIQLHGSCVECKAKIRGTILNEPLNDTDVLFHFRVENIRYEDHTNRKSRQLRGKRRENVADTLIKHRRDAITFRRDEARRLKNYGDVNPPVIPSSAVLRKAKEQRLLQQHDLVFANPALNLLNGAKSGRYVGSIHAIGLLEFFCIYWSPEQQMLYTERHKKARDGFLTIDATGGIAKRSSAQDPPVFLYQCMFVDENGSIPVFQMISADHKALHIAYFLRKILSKGAAVPRMVVSDFGWATLIAVAEVFAKCSDLRGYLHRCYSILCDTEHTIPSCFIRLDVSHLIVMITRWKCLKGKDKLLVRRFYVRCVSRAYQMDSFGEIKYFLQSVLITALSRCMGNASNGHRLISDARVQFLNDVIKGVDVSEPSEDDNDNDNDGDNTDEENGMHEYDNEASNWANWTKSIFDSATEIAAGSEHGSIINALYNPEFANQLRTRLIPYLPLWTGVMRPYFMRGGKIATSSSVEAEFSDLKQRGFGGQLPMRVDKFVHQHLDYIDGKLKLVSLPKDIPEEQLNRCVDSYVKLHDMEIQDSTGDSLEETDRSVNDTKEDTELLAEITEPFQQFDGELASFSQCEDFQPHPTHEHEDQITTGAQDAKGFPGMSSDSLGMKQIDDLCATNLTEDVQKSTCLLGDDQDIWNNVENWRGLVMLPDKMRDSATEPTAKKRAKPSYLDTSPEWDYIKDAKSQNIPLMFNGSRCNPIKHGESMITLQQTCAFDSILQIIASGIATMKAYADEINTSENSTVRLATSILEKKKILARHYTDRAEILLSFGLFAGAITSYTRGTKKLNANCNAAHLVDYIFRTIPSCARYINCPCGYKNSRVSITIPVNVDILLCRGLNFIQQAIDEGSSTNVTCCNCKKSVHETLVYGPNIIVDMTVFTDSRYTTRDEEIQHTLDTVTKTIKLGQRTYILAGIVHYIQGTGLKDGHYVAYALAGEYWYRYNDVEKKRASVSPKTEIVPHVILYVLTKKQVG